MGVVEDITEAYADAFDAEREVLWGDASLVLVLNAGTAGQSELEIEGGWLPEKQQKFGEVNSIYKIEVTDREELTAEVMAQADRLKLGGVLYQFNYDPPLGAPKVWTLYATELKQGGMR